MIDFVDKIIHCRSWCFSQETLLVWPTSLEFWDFTMYV